MPDLLIFPKNGHVFAVELKTGTGQLNEKQIEWRARWISKGYNYYIVRSLDQFKAVIKLEVEE